MGAQGNPDTIDEMPTEGGPALSDYRYERVLLKLSGEALMGDGGYGIDPSVTERLARQIKELHDDGVEVGIVVGGGNIFRGLAGSAKGMDRAQADYMGMLATVMNALALQDAFEQQGCSCRVMSAIAMNEVCEPYIRRRAMNHLSKVDGIYDMDPVANDDATRFESISYHEVLVRGLQVMDSTATALCQDNHMPIIVLNIDGDDNIKKALTGEPVGTVVYQED